MDSKTSRNHNGHSVPADSYAAAGSTLDTSHFPRVGINPLLTVSFMRLFGFGLTR